MIAALWVFAVIGVVLLILIFAPIGKTREEREHSNRSVVPPDQESAFTPSEHVQDAQAIRDHERLAEKYHELIDELYDFGGDVAAKRWEPDE